MKKFFFGAFALALAIASVAFTTKTTKTFRFTGSTVEDLDQPTLWVEEAGSGCGDAGTVCYVTSEAADETEFRALISSALPQSVAAVEAIEDVHVEAEKAVQ